MDDRSDPTYTTSDSQQQPRKDSGAFIPRPMPPSMDPRRGDQLSPQQRALIRQMQSRKQWVFRMVAVLTVIAVCLCFLVMLRRDQLTVTLQVHELEKPVAALQARIDELGRLPAYVSELDKSKLGFYVSDSDRDYAIQASGQVIIAAKLPIELLLSENGRAVVIYENGKVKATWMTVSQYDEASAGQEVAVKEFEKQRKLRLPVLP